MKRCVLYFLLSLLAATIAGTAQAADRSKIDRPNVVLIFVDDLGYGELGCQGNEEVPTPHIDSIAAAGVRFTAGYVTASYCSPSRAGVLTGRYQTRFGHELNPVGAHNEDPRAGLPVGETTIADHLRNAGYATGLVGKWHLGGTAAYHPLRRGFDEFFGFLHEGHFYVPPPYHGATTWLRRRALPDGGKGRWTDGRLVYSTHMGHNEPAYDANNPLLRASQPVAEPACLTDAFSREAVDFIGRHRDEPFFLYLAYNAVHSPMQATDAYMKRFASIEDVQRRIFAAMLSNLDDGVGRLLEKLRDEGLEEETIIFFISDNGGPTRELTSSNRPLRGGKGDVYEGGIRVPFLMQYKGHLPGGMVYRQPVVSLDVCATALAAAGIAPSEDRPIDGVDLMPYLTGRRDDRPHETLFWRMSKRTALRHGDWKLLRTSSWRGDQSPWQLYNLADDLGESNDLAADQPDKLKQLIDVWQQLNGEMIEPCWTPSRR